MENLNESLVHPNSSPFPAHAHIRYTDPPKLFWKYYDLYRRNQLSLNEYSSVTGLSVFVIQNYLKTIVEKDANVIEKPSQI